MPKNKTKTYKWKMCPLADFIKFASKGTIINSVRCIFLDFRNKCRIAGRKYPFSFCSPNL